MLNNLSNDKMFFEAMQIHAVCVDAGIDDEKTRLLTYIHFKIKENNCNLDYFESADETDCASIEIMLGNKKPLKKLTENSGLKGITNALIMDHCENTARNIKKMDAVFRNECGMENRLSSELNNRLRLYRDKVFRDEMIKMYQDIVIPRKDLYEMCTIERAFRQERERKMVEEEAEML